MTGLLPLSFDFPLMSPMSRRQPWTVPMSEIRAELAREIDRRRRVYPSMVAKGAMKPADAEAHIGILAAVARDLADELGMVPARPSWDTKVRELRRELAIRRSSYPKWIANPANPMTEDEARPFMERLEAAHWHVWICLTGWTAPIGAGLNQIFADLRAQGFAIEAWERQARAADDPAARPVDHFTFPPDWTQTDIDAWARGDMQEEAA